MAERRKKLLDLLAIAGRTSGFLVSENQDLKIRVAFHTMIFENRHFMISLEHRILFVQYKTVFCICPAGLRGLGLLADFLNHGRRKQGKHNLMVTD